MKVNDLARMTLAVLFGRADRQQVYQETTYT